MSGYTWRYNSLEPYSFNSPSSWFYNGTISSTAPTYVDILNLSDANIAGVGVIGTLDTGRYFYVSGTLSVSDLNVSEGFVVQNGTLSVGDLNDYGGSYIYVEASIGETGVFNIETSVDQSEVLVDDLSIGDGGGSGTLNISNGYNIVLRVIDGIQEGIGVGCHGTINVSGPDTTLTTPYTSFLIAYDGGYGQLNVTDGGTVSTGGLFVAQHFIYQDSFTGGGSTGIINVSGTGSDLIVGQFYLAGDYGGEDPPSAAAEGTATLNVTNGGLLTVNDLSVGNSLSGSAQVNLDDGTINGSLYIGSGANVNGNGTITNGLITNYGTLFLPPVALYLLVQ
jgi:T5SS/PEP-CTERM-associated repeat protein